MLYMQPLSVRCAVALHQIRRWLYRYRARVAVALVAVLALAGVVWLLHPHGGGVQWPLAAVENDRAAAGLRDMLDMTRARPAHAEFANTVFVGHKHNDADSICSALAAAHLFHGYAARSDPINRETAFLLDRFQLPAPLHSTDATFASSNWCLLDHNQKDKVPDGVDLHKLVCVIDHHQLEGNAVELLEPRSVEIQPWGSTATILAYKFVQWGVELPRGIAGCLLGGILSDTVNLRGPTTTAMDRTAVDYLVQVARVADVNAFADEMFRAKSNMDGLDIHERVTKIVSTDYKQFSMVSTKLGFGVVETIHPQEMIDRKLEILNGIRVLKAQDRNDLMFFAIVDVINLKSFLLGATEEEERIVAEAFNARMLSQHLYDGGSMVSRKKDFIPTLTRYLRAEADRRGDVIDDYI